MRTLVTFPLLLLLLLITLPARAQHYTHGTEPVYHGVTQGACGTCHAGTEGRLGKYGLWINSLHAQAYDSIVIVQNNPECLRCHTTGWDTTQANGGFDDYYRASPMDTAGMARMKNVQCEACHHPYTVGIAYDTSLYASKCGECHGGDPHTPIYDDWLLSKHSHAKRTTIPGGTFNFIASDSNCAGCHTAEGAIQWFQQTTTSPLVVPVDTAKSADITCAACHNPHGSPNTHQLRLPLVAICEKCHNPEYPPDSVGTAVGFEVNHSTAFMFEGVGGYHYPGVTYSNSPHTSVVVNKCVTCHVFTRPFQAGPPIVVAYTGHSFTPQKGACIQPGCHTFDTTAVPGFDYRRTQTRCDSTAQVLSAKLAKATTADSTTAAFKEAKFNLDFYEADGSHGIHNTQYALGLLNSSIANFTPTSDVQEVGNELPKVFALEQNYPNPFNPATTIVFSIPSKERVRVVVYDILGHEVATVIDQEMAPGKYKVTWDGTGHGGMKVASGVYLYSMKAGTYSAVKKMILVK